MLCTQANRSWKHFTTYKQPHIQQCPPNNIILPLYFPKETNTQRGKIICLRSLGQQISSLSPALSLQIIHCPTLFFFNGPYVFKNRYITQKVKIQEVQGVKSKDPPTYPNLSLLSAQFFSLNIPVLPVSSVGFQRLSMHFEMHVYVFVQLHPHKWQLKMHTQHLDWFFFNNIFHLGMYRAASFLLNIAQNPLSVSHVI